MWINHIKIAIRNLRRQSFFSVILVSGLAVGLAVCWLIGLYLMHEKSYDDFLPDADRVCAVAFDLKMGEEEAITTNTPPPVGPRLVADYPEIELAARTFNLGSVVVRRETPGQAPLVFNEETAMAADTAFLELFGFPMAEGDAASALDQPGGIVLTETTAKKYFGKTTAMGQALVLNDRVFTVRGIARDLPSNSTMQFGFLLPTADFKVIDRFSWSWIWLQMDTWVRLRQSPNHENLAALEAKFPAMVRAYAPAAYERIGQNFEDNLQRGDRLNVRLLPLKTLHLDSEGLVSRLDTLGDGRQVGIFGIAGGLILLLACVNFMNLSTARSMQRAREIGVRKALGSQRVALAGQFLTEAMLYSIVSMALAALLAGLSLPLFNRLTGLEWQWADLFARKGVLLVVALPLVAGLLGGLYPAFYLSGFKSAVILKAGKGSVGGALAGLRSGLVVFQFAVATLLMLGSLVVYRQLEFAQKQAPGLQRENVLVLPGARHLGEASARESFRQRLLQMPEAVGATCSTYLPSLGSFGDYYEPEQGDQGRPVVPNLPLSSFLTDADFVPTLDIEIIEGRNFMPHSTTDSNAVILNETAVKTIGWENAVGKWLRYPGNTNQRFQVVGVMRDFHTTSVKMPIEATAIFHESSKTYQTWGSYVALRLRPGTEKTAVAKVAELWKSAAPAAPFEYDFLDASFARLYREESKTASVLGIFTGLAIFIGCLGLFALATFMAEQRTREIGVRKVLGASTASIAALLSRDFLRLVLIALLIATPLAYWAMQRWLSGFAYRVDVDWRMFVSAGLAAIGIALLTVSFQALRAALANPAKSLRSE